MKARFDRHLRDLLLKKAFVIFRLFKPARERIRPGEHNNGLEREHVARYKFARQFCAGKTVADIACGTGYGSQILAEVATSVTSYDKESLCGNRVLDLDKAGWNAFYDVIVSFETIEHLENPEFFLENARRTSKLFVVSSPIGEPPGYNPYHKQVWTFPEFKDLLESRFKCEYYYQKGEAIYDHRVLPIRFVIAVCVPQ
jgi:hypothetical protein